MLRTVFKFKVHVGCWTVQNEAGKDATSWPTTFKIFSQSGFNRIKEVYENGISSRMRK